LLIHGASLSEFYANLKELQFDKIFRMVQEGQIKTFLPYGRMKIRF
jgi:hypothetical protein